jgi:hypothetical protein
MFNMRTDAHYPLARRSQQFDFQVAVQSRRVNEVPRSPVFAPRVGYSLRTARTFRT